MTYNPDPACLVQFRKQMLWTQEDLSAASGVSVRTIQRIEQGERGSLESWKAFAAAFNMDLCDFEVMRDNTVLSEKDIQYGRAGLIFATIWSFVGCMVPWFVVVMGAVQGESSRDLWPFILLGAGLTGCCASILIWGWRRFIRLVPTVS